MKPYIVRPNKYNELDNHRFIVMAETELDLFKTLHEMVQNPRGYEFYEVKKEGLALGLYYNTVNDSGDNYVNLLFSSVTGISKVGHYTGTANNNQYVNVGFACRFLMIKRSDAASQWIVFDSLRGFGNSGTNDSILEWDTQDVARNENVMNLSSSTFNPLGSDNDINADGGNYIYYAHA